MGTCFRLGMVKGSCGYIMNSIFTIERRKNFQETFDRFIEDLKTPVTTSNNAGYKMITYLNRCIRYWPHRCGAVSIEDYLNAIAVDVTKPKDDRDRLLILELYINLLHWAPKQDFLDNKSDILSFPYKKDEIENETERLLKNVAYILEQCCNMNIREIDDSVFPKYRITKRNVRVDAAAVAVPELAEILLGYFDIRNEDDLDYKKTALTSIYSYLEPRRKEFKEHACSSICEEFFAAMNNFGIRHNTKAQIRLQANKKKSVCDRLFMMAVYVLQTQEVLQYKNELKVLREKKTGK